MSLRPADIRDLVFAGLATVAGATLAADVPFIGVPLAAAALGWLAYRHGYATAIAASLLVTAALVPVMHGVLPVVFIGPMLLAAGPGTAWALTRWRALTVVGVLTLVLFASALSLDVASAASRGGSLLAQRTTEANAMRRFVVLSGAQSAPKDAATVKMLADQTARGWMALWPSLYLYIWGLSALLAVPLVARAGRAFGRSVSSLPKLTEFDFNPHVVWPVIVGLALVAGASFLHQPDGWIQAVGMNLLLLVRPILFFQGLGDFAALYKKAGIGKVARGFGFAFLTLSEMAIPSVSVLGLLDIFANLRKLSRGGAGVSAGPA